VFQLLDHSIQILLQFRIQRGFSLLRDGFATGHFLISK